MKVASLEELEARILNEKNDANEQQKDILAQTPLEESDTDVEVEQDTEPQGDDNEVIQPAKKHKRSSSSNSGKGTGTKRVKKNDNDSIVNSNDIKPVKYDKTKEKTYASLQLDKLYKVEMIGEICGVKTYDTGKTWNITLDKTVISSLTYKEEKGRARKISVKEGSQESIPEWKKMIIESVEAFISKKFIMDKDSRDNNTNKVRITVFPYKENGKVCLRYRCDDKRPIMMLGNGDASAIKSIVLEKGKDHENTMNGEKVKVTVIPDNICLIPNKPGCGYDENTINVLVNMKIV